MGAAVLAPVAMGMSAIGAVSSGIAEKQAADYQAQVSANNAKIAQQNANISLAQGQAASEREKEQSGAQLGEIRAMEAASGFDVNSGSNLNTQKSQAEMGELNAENIRYNAHMQARNYLTQSQSDSAQSQLYSSQAGWDMTNSLIGGASSVSNKWLAWQMNAGRGGTSPLPLN